MAFIGQAVHRFDFDFFILQSTSLVLYTPSVIQFTTHAFLTSVVSGPAIDQILAGLVTEREEMSSRMSDSLDSASCFSLTSHWAAIISLQKERHLSGRQGD